MSILFLVLGCLPPPPEATPTPRPGPVAPEPAAVVEAPSVKFDLPTRAATSPAARPIDEQLSKTRETLLKVVQEHARDPMNPWALGHGILALGPELKTDDDKLALPWMFEEFGELREVGGETLVFFPRVRGDIRVEPHTDLVLKVLMEVGTPMETTVRVKGQPVTIEALYRNSLLRTWAGGGKTNFMDLNDTPWALQGLATVAPEGLTWTAENGQQTSLDMFTDVVVNDLHEQTAFMRDAMMRGEKVKKERQGIFSYTCGGAHTLQGAAYAVARGFGSPESRKKVEQQVDVLFWRMQIELEIYDTLMRENPEYSPILVEQRLKFLGHFLESTHKLAALGIYTPNDIQLQTMERARAELIRTVDAIEGTRIFEALPALRSDPGSYQTYLDYVGDSAHAIRAIDLATGVGSITY